ncbi:hypothetical protein CC117_33585 [Parafrankia colletiae]|uniref:DUF3073 domain-containing protein n=1 Tax=Parafrankia colletiae TaxID=573497 RepID=A0A1S1R4H7_9ACTN|nr:DUF3073 domain-containing protein [Parafrankia colletiae]MCK9904759.1 DUF3073 domain-containing protein [Frankia sp. Cpl3]OHV40405.1 hypothetical protein CC117_33585 [Parafrankia colletiae]
MGRGRAKAKHTKVARKLKYASPDLDLDRLQSDLGDAPTRDHDDRDELPDPQALDPADENWTPTG